MNGLLKYSFPICFSLLALFACEDDGIDVDNIEVPAGFALSAGTATNFLTSSYAYDRSADWITGAYDKRFTRGDKLYDDIRTSSNGIGGGLGPVYAGYSCGSCHRNAGRTQPTLWSEGGSGSSGFSSMLVYISRKNGAFFQDYGRVLHDQAIYGVKPEGKLKVEYTYETFQFPDGETYELCKPNYSIYEWYADSIKPEDLFCTVRIPLRHVGMGQMMALDPTEIEALAAKSNYPEYGISGRINYVTEKGKKQIGISGNKANHADLTVELGFSSDLGVTNDRFPHEVGEGQGNMMGFAMTGAQVSTEDMEDVDLYLQTLGVPARRNVDDPTVLQGEQLFYQAKCHLCHVTSLKTRPRGSVLLNNTELPQLGNQVIHPYSDFLLHDMGVELGDDYPSGLANGNEWRTTPLWGLGLQEVVNGHTYYLHDGRARNLTEAIMWHGGEGAASRPLSSRMTKDERAALIKFLQSL